MSHSAPAARNTALRIALIYLVVGGLWIVLSDRALMAVIADPARLTQLQTLKGWAFVVGSAGLLFFLIRSALASLGRSRTDLRQTEEILGQVADHTSIAIWAYALDAGEVIYMTPSAEEIWGRSLESLREDPDQWFDAVHPEDRDRVAAVLGGYAEGGYDEEYRIVRPDGEVRWVRGQAFPIRDEQGQVQRLAGLAEDVTERRRREADLLLLEAAIAQAGEAVMILTAEGVIQYINPAFERVTGYAREDVLGELPRFLKSSGMEDSDYEQLWSALHSGTAMRGRSKSHRKDGTPYTQDYIITPVRTREGRITHMVAVLRDVTHELKLEEQMRQAQKMEAVGRLAGGIAHDFNNVLTAIKGHAGFALDAVHAAAPARDELDEVLNAADRAQNLTRQLLAFSRQQVTEPKVVEIGGVIRSAERMLRRLIGEDVELGVELAPGLGRVVADPTQIEQILVNLAVNARDAMPDGGRITIEAENVDVGDNAPTGFIHQFTPGRYIRLRFADTGAGMDAATRDRIFEPFFTTKAPDRGTGLGLSTVFGIVKQSDGYIRVESEPGAGARFEIYLPRTEEEVERAAAGPEADGVLTGTETILVVEDQAAVRAVVRRTLARAGYQVHEAGNGAEALDVWREEGPRIDLVLTDLVMPQMGGKELAERLRRDRPELPVLFMSGYSEGEISRHGVLDPGTDWLAKPFETRGLQRKVREVLDRHGDS